MDFERICVKLNALLDAGKKAELRGALNMLNEVDIAEYLQTLDNDKMLLVFRLLPKDISAEIFSYMDSDQQTRIIDALGAISEELEEQGESLDDLSDCVDELYEELEEVNGVLFDEGPSADDFMEVICPSCGETIYFDEDMLDSEDGLICPHCNEPVEIDLCCADEDETGDED